ncbi:MAG: serine/threonine transporter SstT [archaeon]|nr:serine/threonine transporter SstT [archaeon]
MIRILVGLVLGTVLALIWPDLPYISLLGSLFVGALKAVAPVLVFLLIVAALSKSRAKLGSQFKYVIILYIFSTVLAALVAVIINFAFPQTVTLVSGGGLPTPPEDFEELITNLASNLVQNPILSLTSGNYLGILFWAIIFGFLLKRYGNDATIDIAQDASNLVTRAIRLVSEFAPIGIFGIIYESISENGMEVFTEYGMLIVILVAAMLIVMFITNPLIVMAVTKRNPYPLLLKCIKTSAITAFFTRSSAANIPVNMKLADEIDIDPELYSVSIPLGATINMAGAAITISTMTLVCANTVGQEVPILLAFVLCILSAVAACGASGVPGGSLLLIPMACSLFGIDSNYAMEMVAVGYIIGVIQDSMETALNSSSDILFTAAADMHERPDHEFKI